MAVDTSVQGHGVGAWLLRDAMLRSLSAAESVGIRVLLVHAIDTHTRAFYQRHGFKPSPTDQLNLQILIRDIGAAVEANQRVSALNRLLHDVSLHDVQARATGHAHSRCAAADRGAGRRDRRGGIRLSTAARPSPAHHDRGSHPKVLTGGFQAGYPALAAR